MPMPRLRFFWVKNIRTHTCTRNPTSKLYILIDLFVSVIAKKDSKIHNHKIHSHKLGGALECATI